MNKQAFLDLIRQPNTISQKDMVGLDEVIANFPYCQAAHILVAKGASDQGKMMADQKVKKAAVYTLERKNLKKLITTSEIKEEAKEDITTILKKELRPTNIPVKEEAIQKPTPKEPFYEDLQKNLRNLREAKVQAIVTLYKKEISKENKPEIKSNLIADKIKEHGNDIDLFSSRMDEVMTERGRVNKTGEITEAELLLNYLTYLKKNKTSVVIDKKKTEEIIEKFIKDEPSIPSLNSILIPETQEDKASESYKLKTNAASETLANIMVLQQKYKRAIEIYQELMLKYPEKRTYFVAQIEKVKEKIR